MQGICFKEPMFKAVVAGIKTQTRRPVFPRTDYTFWSMPTFEGMEIDPDDALRTDKEGDIICDKWGAEKLFPLKGTYAFFEGEQFEFDCAYIRPRYQPNQTVFLKEPYHIVRPIHHPEDEGIFYAYDFIKLKRETNWDKSDWHNKLFMPFSHARYFIFINSVNVQRVNNITKDDAIREGFESVAQFHNYWISMYGFDSLSHNPFVWVYDFKLVKYTKE